ncbi:MAG TPA: AarF/UbiB family protein [Planctomycetota bacterium]
MGPSFRPMERARELGRLGEIATTFAKHGLGDLLQRLGLAGPLERAAVALRVPAEPGWAEKRPEVRLREALEHLGPAFVKLGQLLAGRSDLLPPEWCAELGKLREEVAPVPFAALAAQLREDLGAEPAAVFAALDPEPLAAGSIAQVHRATLADGSAVVLKIRRPGIEEVVSADLALLEHLAERAEAHGVLRAFQPRQVVRQFARTLRGELDLAREARNAERLRTRLPEESRLVVPRIHPELTRTRLCVMEHLAGPSLGEWIEAGTPGDQDPRGVAADGAAALLRMVFVDGLYHADPHAGNVILLADGRLGLIDYGQVGTLSAARRAEFAELLRAVAAREPEAAADVLLGWSSARVDPEELEQDCAEFIERYHGLPLAELDVTRLVGDIHALVRAHGILLPAEVALLLKLLLTLEGLGRALDPGFVASAHVQPFLARAWTGRRAVLRQAARSAGELARLLVDLPRELRGLRARLRGGHLGLHLDLGGLERFSARLDRSVNHLTIGLITAALIVGTSVALTIEGGPRWLGLPLFGALGFLSSVAVGLWWIVVTRRRG